MIVRLNCSQFHSSLQLGLGCDGVLNGGERARGVRVPAPSNHNHRRDDVTAGRCHHHFQRPNRLGFRSQSLPSKLRRLFHLKPGGRNPGCTCQTRNHIAYLVAQVRQSLRPSYSPCILTQQPSRLHHRLRHNHHRHHHQHPFFPP